MPLVYLVSQSYRGDRVVLRALVATVAVGRGVLPVTLPRKGFPMGIRTSRDPSLKDGWLRI